MTAAKIASILEERVRFGAIRVLSRRKTSIQAMHVVIGRLPCGCIEETLC
jgi:hypothetical protein